MTRQLIILAAMLLPALLPAAAVAQVTGPILIGPEPMLVHGGPGAQTDPHISGSNISYTNRTTTGSEIRYQDLSVSGSTSQAIPNTDGSVVYLDSISDVSGSIIVFTRRETTTSTQSIYFFDTANPSAGATELSPAPGARRTAAAIGGDTVAFQQSTTASTNMSAICIADIDDPNAPATCVTDETASNTAPSVSPDGNVVVFQRCTSPGVGCDIYAVTRDAAGAWGTAYPITSGGGNDLSPDTNGSLVVYSSDAAAAGDFDIYYEPVSGTGTATRLDLTDAPGSDEENPNISGSLIAFERTLPGETNADIYIFDIATNTLYQLTDTPDVDEHLNDISRTATGQVYVVWAAVDPNAPADGDNVYSATFTLGGAPPCEEEDTATPAEVCADPGDRPVLGTLTVTRTTGAPNCASTNFNAGDGENGILCVYNSRATSGQVILNGDLQVGSGSFKHSVNTIARAVELEASNELHAGIQGAKGTSYRVVVYGESSMCSASSPKQLASVNDLKQAADVDAVAAGLSLPGGAETPLRTLRGVRVNVLPGMVDGVQVKVLEADEAIWVSSAMGCSTSGGSALWVGALLALALWMMGRRRGPAAAARVRVPRR